MTILRIPTDIIVYLALGSSLVTKMLMPHSRGKRFFLRIASKAHPDKLSGIPDKENVTKTKGKYKWAHNAYQKCQRAYEIMGGVEDDGTYLKRVNYDKDGGSLRMYFYGQVEDIYDCTIRERANVVQDILNRDAIYATQSNNINKSTNTSILAPISKAWRIMPGIQQDNRTSLIFCSAFEAGYSTTNSALEIRHLIF